MPGMHSVSQLRQSVFTMLDCGLTFILDTFRKCQICHICEVLAERHCNQRTRLVHELCPLIQCVGDGVLCPNDLYATTPMDPGVWELIKI